jgi:predicted kinase
VRRCHGDLHLRNIALIAGAPVLFDAIEFDEKIAIGDVLYDLAFLIMDLWQRDLRAAANAVLNRYLWGSPDGEGEIRGLSALPLFLALRAVIRAKVAALAAGQGAGEDKVREAQDYFAAAGAFLAPDVPALIAVGGLSGSGKSTLAARLAPHLGRPPGAVHLRSDIVRKRLFEVPETERLPEDAYAEAATKRVYEALRHGAAAALRAGRTVVVDAVHLRPDERAAIAAVAAAEGAPFTGLWLDAPAPTLEQRVSARKGDASDADAAVVRRQLDLDPGSVAWHRLDAGADIAALAENALALCAPPAVADDAMA